MRQNARFVIAVLLVVSAILAHGCQPACPRPGCPFYPPKGELREGAVIGIPSESIAEYKRLHADTWPGVLKVIDKANIHNYSIYLGEVAPGRQYLFAYSEYAGKDYEADKAQIATDKTMQDWWKLTDPLQRPLPTNTKGEWWSRWEEVFHYPGPAYSRGDIKSRYGSIIGLREDAILAYTQMHAAAWPGVLAALDKANIRDYSIYLGQITPGEYLLFSYFEYIGDDFDADMTRMADKVTKVWWTYTDPLQQRLPGTPEGQQWKTMEEVFHTD
jgi:L-rhamnose mutarotase